LRQFGSISGIQCARIDDVPRPRVGYARPMPIGR